MYYITTTSATYSHFFAMFLLTGDRLLVVLLQRRYEDVVSVGRAKMIAAFTWCLCFGNVVVSMVYYFTCGWNRLQEDWGVISSIDAPAVMSVTFLLLSCITYTAVLVVFVKKRRSASGSSAPMFRRFICSRSFISLVLCISFLVLMVVPNLIRLLETHSVSESVVNDVESYYTYMSVYLSGAVDGIICILYTPVRMQLHRTFIKTVRCFSSTQTVDILIEE